jgi:hypothetical protein
LVGGRGLLKKAREFDYELNSDAYMSYKRTGLGSYIGYENGGHALKIIYFHAKDHPASIQGVSGLTPMKNSVVSFIRKTTFLKNLTLDAEWAMSALVKNVLSRETSPGQLFTHAFKSSSPTELKR